MNDKERGAHEDLLRIANRIMGERIDDSLPGPHDDAQAEYNEEHLIVASRKFVNETRNRKCVTGSYYDFPD